MEANIKINNNQNGSSFEQLSPNVIRITFGEHQGHTSFNNTCYGINAVIHMSSWDFSKTDEYPTSLDFNLSEDVDLTLMSNLRHNIPGVTDEQWDQFITRVYASDFEIKHISTQTINVDGNDVRYTLSLFTPTCVEDINAISKHVKEKINEFYDVDLTGKLTSEDLVKYIKLNKISREWDTTHTKLSNGDLLYSKYGKYLPNLTFIVSPKDILKTDWTKMSAEEAASMFNVIFDGSTSIMTGTFWISRKGTKCFRPSKEGKDALICVDWGGCFNNSRGVEYGEIEKLAKYSHRTSSNGGGTGYNYYILSKDFKKELDIEDI